MDNPQELKNAILSALAEKGDYATILKHLSSEEKEKKADEGSDKLIKLIEPMSAFADMLTENSKGAFMSDLEARLDDSTQKGLAELLEAISNDKTALQNELRAMVAESKESLSLESIARYKETETALSQKMLQLAVETFAAKADELLPSLKEGAKLTDSEIQNIIETAALSVESQITSIIGEYLEEQSITASQITDFKQEVEKLIPTVDFSEISIDISQVRNAPQGGTSAVLVQRMIDNALAGFSGGGGHVIQDEGTPLTQRANLNFVGAGVEVTDDPGNDTTIVTIPGGVGSGSITNNYTNGLKDDQEFTPSANAASEVFTLSGTEEVVRVALEGVILEASEWSQAGADITVTPAAGLDTTDTVTVVQRAQNFAGELFTLAQTEAPSPPNGTVMHWAANGSGTKDGVTYKEGDVLVTSVTQAGVSFTSKYLNHLP